ncbi:4-hydroxybenzoate octaprenyltransferase [Parvibium lacunae]|uniref:4-hydroxybenzoate octaprenyltransferase n=1 Tax=Parvibium lacunae TaxID=1888893 RepID=A0A368L3U4_9BURK|nr:4-hydroxybenzoate octaprenyltransferase [Parvibium lacunae]RCS58261.1 4-hydroxybenzoate octaprenyltransferase [Parvibium lacunae]
MAHFRDYCALIRLDKPIGILLLLWPTLWGLWFAAAGWPPVMILAIFILGTILMRSAGCAVNDVADRHFDRYVQRTQQRPVTTGRISVRQALMLALSLSLCAFLLILPLAPMVWGLAVIALFLAASYPFTKRFFALPQGYLGIAFGFGIPMAYAAVQQQLPVDAWWLMLANVFWALAYDTEYAMVDRADDLKLGIKTAAITFGRYDVLAIMGCYAAALGLLAWVGLRHGRGSFFYAGLAVSAALSLYHYTLIRQREPSQCFRAFRHNNWWGAAIWIGLALDYA